MRRLNVSRCDEDVADGKFQLSHFVYELFTCEVKEKNSLVSFATQSESAERKLEAKENQ